MRTFIILYLMYVGTFAEKYFNFPVDMGKEFYILFAASTIIAIVQDFKTIFK